MSTYTTEGERLLNGLLLTVGFLAGKGELGMAECVTDAMERVFGQQAVSTVRVKLEIARAAQQQ